MGKETDWAANSGKKVSLADMNKWVEEVEYATLAERDAASASYGSGELHKMCRVVEDGHRYEWNGATWEQLGGVTGGAGAPPSDPFVTYAASANLSAEKQHKDLTGAELHPPKAHKTSHQNAGGDEINVAGLSGKLADEQDAGEIKGVTVDDAAKADGKVLGFQVASGNIEYITGSAPGAHKVSHQNGGSDEINVAGLSGELADNQPPKTHKDTHKSGGGDAFASTDNLDGVARVNVSKNSGASVGARREINFIEGTGIALTVTDDAANEEVDVNIGTTGGASFMLSPYYTVYFYNSLYWHMDRDGDTYSNVSWQNVVQHALDNLPAGRTYKECVKLVGSHTADGQVTVPSYSILDLTQCEITLNNTLDLSTDPLIVNSDRTNGNIDIEVWGGILDANFPTNINKNQAITFEGSADDKRCERIKVIGAKVIKFGTSTTSLMASDAASGQKNVTVDDGSKFSATDTVQITDDNATESNVVGSVAGNVLTMNTNLANNYTTAAHGFVAKQHQNGDGIAFRYCKDSEIIGCYGEGNYDDSRRSGLELITCKACSIRFSSVIDCNIGESGYRNVLFGNKLFGLNVRGAIWIDGHGSVAEANRHYLAQTGLYAVGGNGGIDIQLRGGSVYGSGGSGQDTFNFANMKGLTIDGNYIYNGTKNAINVDAAGSGDSYDIKIINNTVEESGSCGIKCACGTAYDWNLLIDNNTVKNSGDTSGASAAINISGCKNAIVTKNTTYDNQGAKTQEAGIQISGNCTGTIIKQNHCSENTKNNKALIWINGAASDGVTIENNVLTDSNKGIALNASVPNTVVRNNRFHNLTTGIWNNAVNTRIPLGNVFDTVTTLYDDNSGNGTAKFDAVKAPFIQGTTFLSADGNSWGWEIDANTEYAVAQASLEDYINQVVRLRIKAVSIVAEADAMRLQIDGFAGADNEAEGTETITIADKPSATTNFSANDYIHWLLTASDDADIDDIVGGDTVQIKVQHEAAGGADCATDAVFQTLEIDVI